MWIFRPMYISSIFVVVCSPVWIQILCSFKISSYFFFANHLLLEQVKSSSTWLIIWSVDLRNFYNNPFKIVFRLSLYLKQSGWFMISFLNVCFKGPIILIRIFMKAREAKEMNVIFSATITCLTFRQVTNICQFPHLLLMGLNN